MLHFILPFGDLSLKTWLSQPILTFKTPTVMLFKIQRLNESSAIWRNWCLGFLKDVSLPVTQGLLVSKMSQQAFCWKISQVCSLAGAPTLHLSLRHRGVLQDHLQEQVMSSHHLRQVFSFDDLGLGEIFVALKRSKYRPQSYRPSLAQHSPYQAGLLPLFWTAASHCSLPGWGLDEHNVQLLGLKRAKIYL